MFVRRLRGATRSRADDDLSVWERKHEPLGDSSAVEPSIERPERTVPDRPPSDDGGGQLDRVSGTQRMPGDKPTSECQYLHAQRYERIRAARPSAIMGESSRGDLCMHRRESCRPRLAPER